ncbi:MAG: amidohydrolase family protein, partial [Kribbellaceae bacterium]|nr:amidohydrolase family protein [Kribbellaceae bacterium]
TLMRGFTTVRDAGGPAFGLKQAIDAGLIPGPRIYPSGAMISQTGGHGDFRTRHEVPRGRTGHLSHAELVGAVRIADGVSAVFEAAREQLMLGASQLKLMAGGGVASPYDPLDVTQYTEDELRAAVEAAENWGTYVMVHAYTPRAVRQSVRAGVKCIEHGQLLDEETVALMAENEVWWSLQPFLDDEDAPPVPPGSRSKFDQMVRGTETAYELARKHDVRLAWGTDTLFDPGLAAKQGKQLAKTARWFTPADVLTMATVTNAELLALSGERNPYPGVLGVVEEGAFADLILVNGNPLDDLRLLATPETSFALIMKQGDVVKDG